ncbi:CapA family protein [Nonomuraea ferruginea]
MDVASMANNHGMDYMETGLADSLAAIKKSRFPIVGIGRDDDQAFKPFRKTVNGNRVAIIGATQVLDSEFINAWTAAPGKGGLASAKDEPRLIKAVRQARKNSDTVIVHLHWGTEMQKCPNPAQLSLAPPNSSRLAPTWWSAGTRTSCWGGRIPRQGVRQLRPRQLRLLQLQPGHHGPHRRADPHHQRPQDPQGPVDPPPPSRTACRSR